MNQLPILPDTKFETSWQKNLSSLTFDGFLVALILIGVFFRFNWVNWSQDTNLHPDEYGLTNTLTQLAIPKTLKEYFNTRISPLSPYQKYDQDGKVLNPGADNRMRWGQFPITIIRLAGEITGNTGYGEIRLLGRTLSALADAISLVIILLIGWKLYGFRVGLLAAALSSLAVMQIQQSHFMTVDNFGGLFTALAMLACVQIATRPPVEREPVSETDIGSSYKMISYGWAWYAAFGIFFGMALASKINLLPIGGLILVAAFISIADLKLKSLKDLQRIFGFTFALLAIAFFAAAVTFRITQPMSFRATKGDTAILSLDLNQDWVDSMKVASAESNGEGGGPPGEQWAHRPAIIFPFVNMVFWGMGLPLGLAAWTGFGWALSQVLKNGKNWTKHLLPLVWVGGYFLFMGTRWVKSVRYFLPIYPFLCLLAAWVLMELWKRASKKENGRSRQLATLFSSGIIWLVILGTLAWANAFVEAVYMTPHTRIQATLWIFHNIPGPFELSLQLTGGFTYREPIEAPDYLEIRAGSPYVQSFILQSDALLTQIELPHTQATGATNLNVIIADDPAGNNIIAEAVLPITTKQGESTGAFPKKQLLAAKTYYLIASSSSQDTISINRVMIANESWDEGLPVPFDGRDPFGQLYRGTTMEVRWPDDEHKREVLLNTLADADYLILPSQRSIWATCRIPETYPMTMEYYRALFDGRLGFDMVASFSSPFQLGQMQVSDVGGSISWGKKPNLPLFNHNQLAAEEAFSVYDHPPVWIFKKRADFDQVKADAILKSVDLSKVVVQSPLNASGDWCPAQ